MPTSLLLTLYNMYTLGIFKLIMFHDTSDMFIYCHCYKLSNELYYSCLLIRKGSNRNLKLLVRIILVLVEN